MKPNHVEFSDVPLPLWAALAAVLLTQSIWLFLDARKRESYPWVWGIWGLVQFPLPTIVYLIVVRKVLRKRR